MTEVEIINKDKAMITLNKGDILVKKDDSKYIVMFISHCPQVPLSFTGILLKGSLGKTTIPIQDKKSVFELHQFSYSSFEPFFGSIKLNSI